MNERKTLNRSVQQQMTEPVLQPECGFGEGDAFHFQSTLPHKFRNIGYSKAKIIWITTPPVW